MAASIEFFWMFFQNLAKTFAVLWNLSKASEYPKRFLLLLYRVAYQTWNTEIKRFMDQLSFEGATFTGKGFFYINRNLIFSVSFF